MAAPQPAALDVQALSKAFPGVLALDGVHLEVGPGEIHAVVGHNGSGKSTLIKVLAGCETPEAGARILVGGAPLETGSPQASHQAGLRFVHQDLGLIDAMSVADNICLTGGWQTSFGTIHPRAAAREAARALEAIELDVDVTRPVGELSAAARTGVAVARALRPDDGSRIAVLVLDEPTATLPIHEVERLLAVIRSVAGRGIGVLYVSHRLGEVIDLADRATVLRDGCNIATLLTRDLSPRDLASAMLGFELEHVPTLPAGRRDERAGAAALGVEGLSAGVLDGVDLTLEPGEIVGVAGIEGSGRDHLLPALFGALPRRGGAVRIAGRPHVGDPGPRASIAHGLAYVPADREHHAALPTLPARENVTISDLRSLSRRGGIRRDRERDEVAGWFDRLDVRPSGALEEPFDSFSGGNQQKLVLARALRCAPDVLLLEEPSQGVDVGAQARLHVEINRFAADGGAVLVSSSDADELARLCHRVLVFQRGRVAAELGREALSEASISQALLAEVAEVAG
jgi:ribose transport system ATP-binding protein